MPYKTPRVLLLPGTRRISCNISEIDKDSIVFYRIYILNWTVEPVRVTTLSVRSTCLTLRSVIIIYHQVQPTFQTVTCLSEVHWLHLQFTWNSLEPNNPSEINPKPEGRLTSDIPAELHYRVRHVSRVETILAQVHWPDAGNVPNHPLGIIQKIEA